MRGTVNQLNGEGKKPMKYAKSVLMVAVVALAGLMFAEGPAKAHVWLDIYGPNVRDHHFHIHVPEVFSSYYYSTRPHQPHHGLPPHVEPERQAICHSWHNRCGVSWGFNNVNYRGCMRYHGCY